MKSIIYLPIGLLLALLGFVVGFSDGKSRTDRWYAKHWHPDLNFSDVLDESKTNKVFVGMMSNVAVDDVLLVGHGITVVNTSHVMVIQCRDETFSTFVALSNGDQLVCSDAPEFNWKQVKGKMVKP